MIDYAEVRPGPFASSNNHANRSPGKVRKSMDCSPKALFVEDSYMPILEH